MPRALLRSTNPADVLAAAAHAAARGRSGVMATVIERHGSAPGTPGQKLYVDTSGNAVGSVGGGAVEKEVLAAMQALLDDLRSRAGEPKFELRTFKLGAELGMCCGGRIVVMIEPIAGLTPLLIVGAGHVGTAAAPLLVRVGFAVTIIDAREEWAPDGRIAGVRGLTGDYDELEVDPNGVFLVMTHDHALDQEAIEWALKKGFAFVGGVGSRAKAERTRQRLEAKGFSASDRARVRMPVGADIGARSPDEIAVAIAAELIAWRHAR